MFRAVFLAALCAFALSGCVFFETKADRAMRNNPSFRAGYEDGCASATNEGANMRRGNIVRDDALYDSDKAYRVGWSNGHLACRRGVQTGQEPNDPLKDQQPGGGH